MSFRLLLVDCSMLRKYLIQRYVDVSKVEEMLGHSLFVFLRVVLLYSILLFLIYVGYAIWHQYDPAPYVKRTAGILALLLFAKWVISFLNLYLDCLLLSKDHLTIFLWDGVLQYRTQVLDWSKINAISYTQNSLRDKLFGKGDLLIQVGTDIDFSFQEVAHPQKYVAKILMFKKHHLELQQQKVEEDLKGDATHMEIIVDALGEVIKEYLSSAETSSASSVSD